MSFITSSRLSQKYIDHIPITFQKIEYDPNLYNQALFNQYQIDVPVDFSEMHSQRKASYLAGRIAARTLFQALEIKPVNIAVGKNRCPIWPNKISGSISHSSNTSIAGLVFPTELNHHLGIDLQSLIPQDQFNTIYQHILNDGEMDILKSGSASYDDLHCLTTLFSVKESFFKAIYPKVNCYFDFKDVSVTSVDSEKHAITLVFKRAPHSELRAKKFRIYYDWLESNSPSVHSYCYI